MELADIVAWPGKSATSESGVEHPAACHMLDVAAVAEILIDGRFESPLREALIVLVALHDVGKFSAPFRAMLRSRTPTGWRHWQVSEAWLRKSPLAADFSRRLGVDHRILHPLIGAVAGHHGRPSKAIGSDMDRMIAMAGEEACAAAGQFIAACFALWPQASLNGLRSAEARTLSWWLSGLTTVADWVGSNADWFPAFAPSQDLPAYLIRSRTLARAAVDAAGLRLAKAGSASELFPFALRPMQAAAERIALIDGPMLACIEDETGAGKTEAALLLAGRMLKAGKGAGLFFALPTMATADAMFTRLDRVVGRMFATPPSLTLAHGRSGLSAAFREVQGRMPGSDAPVCGPWLADSRRKALLADVGVGTVDQALLAVLPTRFATLRQWGLSSKILIVDEAHELGNPYMATELATLLQLHAMNGGSAILLTATLPLGLRARLCAAFEAGAGRVFAADPDRAYPALSISNGPAVREFPVADTPKGPVAVRRLATAEMAADIIAQAAGRGAACVWVRNAVDDAIKAVALLQSRGVEAMLLHARFALSDRKQIEADVLARFGREGRDRAGRVLVATQVVEASLDLDFDVMVSDLAPMAALIQRAGRLWRHMDRRPAAGRPVTAPVLHILSPDPGEVTDSHWLRHTLEAGAWVYPLAEQWRTADVLFREGCITAPGGLRALTEAVHGADTAPVPVALEQADLKQTGEDLAQKGLAMQNVVDLAAGYRESGGGNDDREYPTRLGREMRTLMLVRTAEGEAVPWAAEMTGDRAEAEMLSEVQAAASRLRGLALPAQDTPDIRRITAGWPDWKRAATTVCLVGLDGTICPGLRYEAGCGLIIHRSPSGDGP